MQSIPRDCLMLKRRTKVIVRECHVSLKGSSKVPVTASERLGVELPNATEYTLPCLIIRNQSTDTA